MRLSELLLLGSPPQRHQYLFAQHHVSRSLHYIPVPKSGSESTEGTLFGLALNHSCYVRSGPHKMSLSARPITYPWLTGAPLGSDLVIGTLREPEERFLSTFEAFLGKKHSVQKLNKVDAAFVASPAATWSP